MTLNSVTTSYWMRLIEWLSLDLRKILDLGLEKMKTNAPSFSHLQINSNWSTLTLLPHYIVIHYDWITLIEWLLSGCFSLIAFICSCLYCGYFVCYLEQVFSTPGCGGIVPGSLMLAPTRPPSLTHGGRNDLYYSPPPPPLSYKYRHYSNRTVDPI